LTLSHCPHCRGTLKIIAAILESGAITKILDHPGSSYRANLIPCSLLSVLFITGLTFAHAISEKEPQTNIFLLLIKNKFKNFG